jgi:hypothetical protein
MMRLGTSKSPNTLDLLSVPDANPLDRLPMTVRSLALFPALLTIRSTAGVALIGQARVKHRVQVIALGSVAYILTHLRINSDCF